MSNPDDSITPAGKPPKSTEQIRSALESMHRNTAPPAGLGPLSKGLREDDRLVLTAFHNWALCSKFQQELLEAGLMSSIQTDRGKSLLLVDAGDRERAAERLTVFLRNHPDTPPKGHRRPLDYTLFGLLVGGSLGFIALAGNRPWPEVLLLVAALAFFGALTGGFVDFSRRRYFSTGQFQFGIGDLLGLMTLLAVAGLVWRLLR